jgi:hypothetical protein
MQIAVERIRRFKRWIVSGLKSGVLGLFKRSKVAASEKSNPALKVKPALRFFCRSPKCQIKKKRR